MSTVSVNRYVSLDDLVGIQASAAWDGTTTVITSNVAQAQLQAAVDAAPARPDPAAQDANGKALDDLLDQALAGLATIIAAAPITFTTIATAQTEMRKLQNAVQFEAQVLRRLIRRQRRNLAGTD